MNRDNPDPAGAVEALVKALVQELNPEFILLFGSRSRGDARPDSDYDLLVVARTSLPPGRRACRAYLATNGLGVSRDILVYTPEEFERLSTWRSSVVAWAIREGRKVYEAA